MKAPLTNRPAWADADRGASRAHNVAPLRRAPAAAVVDGRAASLAQLQHRQRSSNSPQAARLQACASMMAGRTVEAVLQRVGDRAALQVKFAPALGPPSASVASRARPVQREEKPNQTGLPTYLKSGIESLSGMTMDHVKVHYHSDKPAQMQAHAYAQGSDIHLAPGQERHLPHEAWHVVQQAQGRVRPTVQIAGAVAVNDDVGLEAEADSMGANAVLQGREMPVSGEGQDLNAPLAQPALSSAFDAGPPKASQRARAVGSRGDALRDDAREAPVQRLRLGADGEIDTLDEDHIVAVRGYLESLDYDSLEVVRHVLDAEDPRDQSYIKLINYLQASADALGAVSQYSQDYGGIFTSATILLNGQLLGTTEPIAAIDSSTTYYQFLPDMPAELEDDQHNSRNDSEVSTLERAYDLIAGVAAEFTAGTQLRIFVAGTSGPCDACKKRLELFRDEVFELLPPGGILSIDSAYLNSTRTTERNRVPTRYGYENQTGETSARSMPYFNHRLPLAVKPTQLIQRKAIEQVDPAMTRGRPLDEAAELANAEHIPAQLVVDNGRRAIGRSIVISNPRARDVGDRGVIERDSRRRDYFAVEFDNEPGPLYRVHYQDMDYCAQAQPEPRAPVEAADGWTAIASTGGWQNCTDFAFEGHPELVLQADLQQLLAAAQRHGYTRATSAADATVVLYGSHGNYSHAIRKVGGVWTEVTSLGGGMRQYAGSDPPGRHSGDVVVAMLRRSGSTMAPLPGRAATQLADRPGQRAQIDLSAQFHTGAGSPVQRVALGDAKAFTDGWCQIVDDTGNWMAFVRDGRVVTLVPREDFQSASDRPVNDAGPKFRDQGCSVCVAADYLDSTVTGLLADDRLSAAAKKAAMIIYQQNGYTATVESFYKELRIMGEMETFLSYAAMASALTADHDGAEWQGGLAWEGHIVRISGAGAGFRIWDPQTGAKDVAVPRETRLVLITFIAGGK